MPSLNRPDGVEIHWETRGEGPLVLLAPHSYAYPDVYRGLLDDLERDHLVVTYDPRGTGRSTRVAPTRIEEDVADLEAVLEAAGGGGVVLSLGDGMDRAALLAVPRPDLVRAVMSIGATVAPAADLAGAEGPAASEVVVKALHDLGEANVRAGIRGVLELTNPGTHPEEVRARVDATLAYASEDAIRIRYRWLRAGQNSDAKRALGDRLWILHWESAWSPRELADRLREVFPDAHVEELDYGPISRPDLTAALVRRASAES
jgi:pimeloyl-ACP methyl ester carboxylesterase